MKSRFSACFFAFCKSDYIIKQLIKKLRFFFKYLILDIDIEQFCKNTSFENLEILDFIDSEIESFVTFKATLFQNKKISLL